MFKIYIYIGLKKELVFGLFLDIEGDTWQRQCNRFERWEEVDFLDSDSVEIESIFFCGRFSWYSTRCALIKVLLPCVREVVEVVVVFILLDILNAPAPERSILPTGLLVSDKKARTNRQSSRFGKPNTKKNVADKLNKNVTNTNEFGEDVSSDDSDEENKVNDEETSIGSENAVDQGHAKAQYNLSCMYV